MIQVLVSPTGQRWTYDDERTRLIDFAPYVLDALKDGSKNQGDLQEAVFGSSGRGNSSYKPLFELLSQRGFLKATKKGRSTIYSLA